MRGRFAACAVVLVLGTAACGGGRTTVRPDTSFDEASSRVVHPSTARGGTLRLAVTDAPVSLDPGDIGLAYEADLARLYARSLVTYAAAPGSAGLRLVPDLAEGLGRPGDGGRTWTYRLRAGSLDADLAGAGVQPATRTAILAAPAAKARADDPPTGLVHYAALSTGVAPFDDVHCRRAVQYAVDRATVQRAYGGPTAGAPATTVLPATVTGYGPAEPYPHDPVRARRELAACGRPTGFATGIAVRGDRPGDVAAAQALRQALVQTGIDARVTTLPAFQWGSTAGSPAYVHRHGLGVLIDAWAGNRPTGYAFLRPLTGPVAKVNNPNLAELRAPRVDRLLAAGAKTADAGRRAQSWAGADRAVMETGARVPLLVDRTVLYRPDTLANAYVHPVYGMYDYAALGVRKPPSP